jgi:hypothetical protein
MAPKLSEIKPTKANTFEKRKKYLAHLSSIFFSVFDSYLTLWLGYIFSTPYTFLSNRSNEFNGPGLISNASIMASPMIDSFY